MSRSHDDDEFDDEDDGQRRRDHDDESSEDDAGDDEENEAALGGWRPFGEAVFWGVVFLGLTVVAFSLGEGIGVKKPLAGKEIEAEKPVEKQPQPEPAKNNADSAFEDRIDGPAEKPNEETDSKINFGAPPKTTIVPAKVERQIPDEPTTRLDWQASIAKSELKLKPKPKPAPIVDDGPTRRLDVEALTKAVVIAPATHLLDVAAMIKEV